MSYYFDNISYSNIYPSVTAKLNSDILDCSWKKLRQHNKGEGTTGSCQYDCPQLWNCSWPYQRNKAKSNNACNFPSCDNVLFRTEIYTGTVHHPLGCHVGTCDKYKVFGDLWGSCGQFNPSRTCTVKSKDSPIAFGKSTGDPPVRDKDWYTWKSGAKPANDKILAGWAWCVYEYDISKLKLDDYNSNIAYSYFLNSMAVGTNNCSMFNSGLNKTSKTQKDQIGQWLCRISLFSLPIQMWFNELYENNHFNFSDITGQEPSTEKTTILNHIRSYYFSVLQNLQLNDWPDNVVAFVQSKMVIPSFQMESNGFNMLIPLSYTQFKTYQQSSNKEGVISNYMQFMLNDANSSFATGSGQKVKNKIPEFNLYSQDPVSVNILSIDPVTLVLSTEDDPISYKDYTTNDKYKNTGYMAVSFNISVKITKWTAMLAVLALLTLNEQDELPDIISDQITNDTGFLPLKTYTHYCGDTITSEDKCMNYIRQYCSAQTFNPPKNYDWNTIHTSLFIGDLKGSGSDESRVNVCQCYNSLLQPVIGRKPGNISAMCFDKSCNDPSIQQLFKLSDNLCANKCSDVYSWIYNNDPLGPNAGANPFWLNKAKYDKLCGQDYQPLQSRNISLSLLGYGIAIAISILLLVYAFLYMYKVSKKNTIITICCVGSVCVGILILFIIDTMGQTTCGSDNKTPTCKSKIFGWKLPDEFCPFMSACECQSDNDCGSDCTCISSICIPNTGTFNQATQTEYQHISYWKLGLLGVLLFMCTALFVISLYIFKDPLISLFLFSTALVCIFAALLPSFTRKVSVKYGNACGKTDNENKRDLVLNSDVSQIS